MTGFASATLKAGGAVPWSRMRGAEWVANPAVAAAARPDSVCARRTVAREVPRGGRAPDREGAMRRLRRFVAIVAFVAVVVVLAKGPGPHSAAQDGTPAAAAGHPLVGSWAAVFGGDVAGGLFLAAFSGDGTVVVTDFDGDHGVGSWAATGPRSATVTYVFLGANDAGLLDGSVAIRAAVEVDPAGGAFMGETSYTFVAPDGAVGDTGLLVTRGVRLPVEGLAATGNPLAGFPTLGDGGAGTPMP